MTSSSAKPSSYNRHINNLNKGCSSDYTLQLQRTIGNQAVQRLVPSDDKTKGFAFAEIGILQPKLKISQPYDAYEQEADKVTEQVMRRSMTSSDLIIPTATTENETCMDRETKEVEEDQELKISLKSSAARFEVTSETASEISKINSSSGASLDPNTREFMKSRFGHDFSSVRVHTDRFAARSALMVDAKAYTIGNNVVFGAGQYSPQTDEGSRLIAHELTHVVQQRRLAGGESSLFVQRQPKEKSEARSERKEKTLAEQDISSADPATQKSAMVIQAVLRRSKRLEPYLSERFKSGFSIAEKGRFILHQNDGNFENEYRNTYKLSAGETVPKHTTGFFDPKNSVVHLRSDATFGTALHEAMHRSAALPMNTSIAGSAKAISEDFLKILLEGTTAYMVDLVLTDEGLPNFNDAYRDEKNKISGLVTDLGKNGFDSVARMYFHGNLLPIAGAVGISQQQYVELAKRNKTFDQVLRKVAARL
jgi:hypothetical protein